VPLLDVSPAGVLADGRGPASTLASLDPDEQPVALAPGALALP
jgi:hypothetical protein